MLFLCGRPVRNPLFPLFFTRSGFISRNHLFSLKPPSFSSVRTIISSLQQGAISLPPNPYTISLPAARSLFGRTMSSTRGNGGGAPRRRLRFILGKLDPNRDLNTDRGRSKRLPIVLDIENEDAVAEGVMHGTYDLDQVMDYTNWPNVAQAPPGEGSDDEDLALQVAQASDDEEDVDAEFGAHGDELLGEVMDEDIDDDDEHGGQADDDEHLQGPMFDPAAIGLREINNLAHFGVSSHKPGNGVEQLLSDDLDQYWQ